MLEPKRINMRFSSQDLSGDFPGNSETLPTFAAITAAIPARDRELYTLLLGMHETGTRINIEAYAIKKSISASTVYDRLKKLGKAIQLHPMFAQIAATYRPDFQPA